MYEKLQATFQKVTFKAVDRLDLPEYKGSTFRGALGISFKQVACALRRQTCETCLLRFRCAYSVCFETPVPETAEMMKKYPYAPHPFVLEPPEDNRRSYEPGEEFSVGLWLVGRGADYLAHFIYAFDEMGRQGLGRERGKMELVNITGGNAARNEVFYDHSPQRMNKNPVPVTHSDIAARAADLDDAPLRLTFETPMRVKAAERFTNSPDLGGLFPSLLRRLSSLHYFHCGGEEGGEVRPLIEAARQVKTIRAEVHWVDWNRYSARQDTIMQLGGFVGTAGYEPVPRELLPILCWGELLHLGKASAFGLGKYRIQPLS